jgi:hypothetical protein
MIELGGHIKKGALRKRLSMKQLEQSKLKKNFSAWAIFSILNNTKLDEKEVIGWRLVGGKKVTTQLRIRVIRKFRGEIAIVPVDEEMSKEFDTVLSGMDKLNLYLPEDMVLFQSEIKSILNNEVVVGIPKMIAQVDRRKYLRLQVSAELNVMVAFKKKSKSLSANIQNFKKSCFDISAGGLSFITSRMELKFFNIGDDLKMLLLFDDQKITISGEIVTIIEVSPEENSNLHYKGWKICVKYKTISSAQRKLIDEFVFKNINTQIDAI